MCLASTDEKGNAIDSNGNCKIDSKSWKSCQYCRFEKCVDTGMKPGWTL